MDYDEFNDIERCIDCDKEAEKEEIRLTEYNEVICYECSLEYNQCDMCGKFTKKELSGPSKFGFLCEECLSE